MKSSTLLLLASAPPEVAAAFDDSRGPATHARRRYPHSRVDNPFLALAFYESDRRTAGMGALKPMGRRVGGMVRNTKTMEPMMEIATVLYTLRVERLGHMVLPDYDPFELCNIEADSVVATWKPPARADRFVRLEAGMLGSQNGRNEIARVLRKARRDMHRELESAC